MFNGKINYFNDHFQWLFLSLPEGICNDLNVPMCHLVNSHAPEQGRLGFHSARRKAFAF